MWKTIIALIISIVIIPLLAFRFDAGLNQEQTEILKVLITVYVITALSCFIISTLSKNYSQVDKLWSIIPLAYIWIIAIKGNLEPRLLIMAVLVSLWGIRLSYNFSRRGGYS